MAAQCRLSERSGAHRGPQVGHRLFRAPGGGAESPPGPRKQDPGGSKKAKKWPFFPPLGAKPRGSGGAPPTHLILLRNQRVPACRRPTHARGPARGARGAPGAARGASGGRRGGVAECCVASGGGWRGGHRRKEAMLAQLNAYLRLRQAPAAAGGTASGLARPDGCHPFPVAHLGKRVGPFRRARCRSSAVLPSPSAAPLGPLSTGGPLSSGPATLVLGPG